MIVAVVAVFTMREVAIARFMRGSEKDPKFNYDF